MNTVTLPSPTPTPWYRQLWPWLLMLMPGIALVGGVATYYLAATTNNALVVDDYYREGKAINRQLARDALARQLGLKATLVRGPAGEVRIDLAGNAQALLPPALRLKVVHATRADQDQTFDLRLVAPGRYASTQGMLPIDGRWNLLLEDPAGSWRLTTSVSSFGQAIPLTAQPD